MKSTDPTWRVTLILAAAILFGAMASCSRQQGANEEPSATTNQSPSTSVGLADSDEEAEASMPPAHEQTPGDRAARPSMSVNEVWIRGYSNERPCILDIETGMVRPGERPWPDGPDSPAKWAALVRPVGDVNWDGRNNAVVIASGRCALITPQKDAVALSGLDLAGRLNKKYALRWGECHPGAIVLLRTRKGTHALLQIGGVRRVDGVRELQVFWIHQPDGSARFPEAALAELAARAGVVEGNVSVLSDLAAPNPKVLDMAAGSVLPPSVELPIAGCGESGKKTRTWTLEEYENALRSIELHADLIYRNGWLIAGSGKAASLPGGRLADYAGLDAGERIRRRGGKGLRANPDDVFVLLTRDGDYALCRVLAKEGRTITVRWVLRRRGEDMFPVVAPDQPGEPRRTDSSLKTPEDAT